MAVRPYRTSGRSANWRGELDHQPHAGGGERVADRDRAAPLVDARVVVVDAEVVEQREHLHGERLVELEQADVVDREARPCAAPSRCDGTGPMPMISGSTPANAKLTMRILGVRPSSFAASALASRLDGRAVVEAGGVAGGDPAVRAERRLQGGEALHRRLGAQCPRRAWRGPSRRRS